MSTARRHDAIVLTILLLVPVALFADVLFGDRVLYFGDVGSYHYPLKKILREIVSHGDFPQWNPYVSGGQPLAANAAHEVFYPPTWLILLPGFNFGFHLLIVLQLLIATFGMYALLRSMELRRFSALLGALAFGCGGLLVSATITFPFLFSASWIPWVCLFARRFLRTGDRRAFALAAAALAMQLLIGEPTTALQTGILLLFYARRQFVRVAMIGVVALLLAAVQVIPLIDHFRDTDRARGVSFDVVSRRSTPPLRIAELLVPFPFGSFAPDARNPRIDQLYPNTAPFFRSIYPGMLLGALALAALLSRARGWKLSLSILALSLLLAAGSHTPLLRALYDLGVASVIRYPEKFLIMGVSATIVFAAHALERLVDGDDAMRKRLLIVLVIVAASTFVLRDSTWQHLTRALALLLIVAALPRLRKPLALAALAGFVFVDLATVVIPLQPRVESSYYDEPAALKTLPPDRDSYRVFALAEWSTSSRNAQAYRIDHPDLRWIRRNELLPLTPLSYGLRLALDNDYDLTGLARSTDFTLAASKLAEEKHQDWISAVAAMSNVRAISVYRNPQQAIAEARGVVRDVQPVRFVSGSGSPRYYFSSMLVPIRTTNDFLAHLRARRFPRDVAFVEGTAFQPAPGRVLSVRESNNAATLDVEADGNAFLVMSVTAHKYWRVAIDGREVPVVHTNIAWQGVSVPRGKHVVTMRYSNPLLAVGGAISLIAALALIAMTMRRTTMRAL
jgi:membrane protein YfhO